MASGIINMPGISAVQLWQNSSPTSAFAAQTVQLDLSNYDGILLVFLATTTDTNRQSSMICLKGHTSVFFDIYVGTTAVRSRSAQVTDTGVKFSTGYNNTSSNTSSAIPYQIFGIKGLL